jgi:hypothetical protein
MSSSTERQKKLLARSDGRYFALDAVGTGLGMLAKAEWLGKRRGAHFGLPSGPALFLNLARRAYLRTKDVDIGTLFVPWHGTLAPHNTSVLFDFFEDCSAHVIFAFTAIEAFANEVVPVDYVYECERNGQAKRLPKAEIERSVSLDEKLDLVIPAALGTPSPKGKVAWQRFQKVKRMRNRLIHLKTVDRSASGPEQESVWGMLLRSHGEAFCDHAHATMGHFPVVLERRWFREYPYEVREEDGSSVDDYPDVE